jgi:FdhE protein
MSDPSACVDRLLRERTEWRPWLNVLGEILRESSSRRWDERVLLEPPAVADAAASDAGRPLLAARVLPAPGDLLRQVALRLIEVATSGGTPEMRTLRAIRASNLDVLGVFTASVAQDAAWLERAAQACGADVDAFQAFAIVLPVPFLQACQRRWAARIPASWLHGYCPICGSWPAFAEVRGIERSRHFRCGRCGGEWHARSLWCPYCAMTDHNELVSHVPEKGAGNAVIDACQGCRGYVKTFTRLQRCPSETVILEDLASVAFDVAAVNLGYQRPGNTGYPVRVILTDAAAVPWSLA